MDKTSSAEWLLKMVCGQQRAAEIVGDLLEEKSGVFSFWHAVVQVIFTWSWRWLAGILVAAASSVALMFCLAKFFLLTMPSPAVENSVWATASLCLCSTLAVNMCRFGIRDRVTVVAACLTFLLIGAVCASPFLQAQYLWFGVTSVLGLGMVSTSTRKPLLVLLGAAIAYAGIVGLLMQALLRWPGTRSPVFMFYLPCCWLIGLICEARVLAEMRRFAGAQTRA